MVVVFTRATLLELSTTNLVHFCSTHLRFLFSRIRSPGSAAVNMCLVACGSADAYYHMGIHCWDMAGGAAIVTEAGGVIMDISGKSLIKCEHHRNERRC